MLIETFSVGMLSTNCYVVNCEETLEAIVIDPGLDYSSEAEPIFSYVDKAKLKVKFIVNTHGHSDHVNGDGVMQQKYKVPVCINAGDMHFLEGLETAGLPANVLLNEGDVLKFGTASLKILHTPGHTPGSVCLVGDRLVFSGDTLFAGSIGRTDFPESSWGDMRVSLRKLLGLSDRLLVYPGHGGVSVLGEEKRLNPFLQDL
jgi:glyoxylase-like metal-dependent hydrolase (beta-lactamase superfamily II)